MSAIRHTHRSKTVGRRRPRAAAQSHSKHTKTAASPLPEHARVVLIATDGSKPANAAMKLGRLMASKGAWTPEVVSVMLPLPVAVGDLVLPAPSIQYETVVSDNVGESVRHQLQRYGDISWRLAMEFGRPIPTIARTAKERKAALIVLGLGQHGRLARLLGAETVARVSRHTDIPVLAVHAATRKLPSVALAAVDFGESSVRAAREALALLEPPGRLHLVHVKWSYNTTSFADSEWERAYAAGADEEFARVRGLLGSRPGIEITTTLLTGGVVERLLVEAASIHADVLALGSRNQNAFDRLMIGSTPAQVLRAAECSVLIASAADAKA